MNPARRPLTCLSPGTIPTASFASGVAVAVDPLPDRHLAAMGRAGKRPPTSVRGAFVTTPGRPRAVPGVPSMGRIWELSSRPDPTWSVVTSARTPNGDRCVDVFVRPSGTYGYEEFGRDPDDMGVWTPLHHLCDRELSDLEEVLDAVRRSVPWFVLMSEH